MKKDQANIEICKLLAKGKLVYAIKVDDDCFVVFPNGSIGYFFYKSEIIFSIDKVIMRSKENTSFPTLSLINPQNELKIKDRIRLSNDGTMFRIFTANSDREVYINLSFLKLLNMRDTIFYQEKDNPNGIIVAVEDEKPVMFLCPCHFYE